MKKQIQPGLFAGKKLVIGKKTISNLGNAEMKKQMGGDKTRGAHCTQRCSRDCSACTTEMSASY